MCSRVVVRLKSGDMSEEQYVNHKVNKFFVGFLSGASGGTYSRCPLPKDSLFQCPVLALKPRLSLMNLEITESK